MSHVLQDADVLSTHGMEWKKRPCPTAGVDYAIAWLKLAHVSMSFMLLEGPCPTAGLEYTNA